MKKYWNITVIFILTSFIVLNFLNLSTSILITSPNLINTHYLEDLKTIYEVNQSVKSLYESGTEIEDPDWRTGGGYKVTVNFFSKSKSYYMQGDRIIYSEHVNGELVLLRVVEVNREDLKVVALRVHYIWNQLDKLHG